jgi:hypothetical protein
LDGKQHSVNDEKYTPMQKVPLVATKNKTMRLRNNCRSGVHAGVHSGVLLPSLGSAHQSGGETDLERYLESAFSLGSNFGDLYISRTQVLEE